MRVKPYKIYILLLIIPWFFPTGITLLYPGLNFPVNAWKCISWAMILYSCAMHRKRLNKFTKILHILWGINLIIVLLSDFSPETFNTWATIACSVCGVALLYVRYGKKATPILYHYLLLSICVNLILRMLMPNMFMLTQSAYDGLSTYTSASNFLCTDNTFGPILMTMLLLNELMMNVKRKLGYFMYAFTWIICLVSAISIFSATCLVALLVVLILKIIEWLHLLSIRIKPAYLVALVVLIFVGIYFLDIQRLFAPLIVNLLGKDLTLTRRLGLWSDAIALIKQRPLFGWGNARNGAIILREFYYWYAHNIILDILLQGGIAMLVAFAAMLRRFALCIKGVTSNRTIRRCMIMLVGVATLNIAESYFSNVYMYVPLILTAWTAMDIKASIVKSAAAKR